MKVWRLKFRVKSTLFWIRKWWWFGVSRWGSFLLFRISKTKFHSNKLSYNKDIFLGSIASLLDGCCYFASNSSASAHKTWNRKLDSPDLTELFLLWISGLKDWNMPDAAKERRSKTVNVRVFNRLWNKSWSSWSELCSLLCVCFRCTSIFYSQCCCWSH